MHLHAASDSQEIVLPIPRFSNIRTVTSKLALPESSKLENRQKNLAGATCHLQTYTLTNQVLDLTLPTAALKNTLLPQTTHKT